MPNSPGPTSMPTELSRTRIAVRVALIAILVTVAGYALADFVVERKLERAQWQAAKIASVRFADYVPDWLPPDTPNASGYLEAAALLTDGQRGVYTPRQGPAIPTAKALSELKKTIRAHDLADADLGDEELELARSIVEASPLALAVLDEAVDIADEARYQTNYDDIPSEIIIPNLLTRIRFALLFRARGWLAAVRGDTDQAWHDAAAIFTLADFTGREMPTLINALVARVVFEHGCNFTRQLLAIGPPSAEQRDQLLREARKSSPRELMDHALHAERAAVASTLLDSRTSRSPGVLVGESRNPLPRIRMWLRLNAALYLDSFSRFDRDLFSGRSRSHGSRAEPRQTRPARVGPPGTGDDHRLSRRRRQARSLDRERRPTRAGDKTGASARRTRRLSRVSRGVGRTSYRSTPSVARSTGITGSNTATRSTACRSTASTMAECTPSTRSRQAGRAPRHGTKVTTCGRSGTNPPTVRCSAIRNPRWTRGPLSQLSDRLPVPAQLAAERLRRSEYRDGNPTPHCRRLSDQSQAGAASAAGELRLHHLRSRKRKASDRSLRQSSTGSGDHGSDHAGHGWTGSHHRDSRDRPKRQDHSAHRGRSSLVERPASRRWSHRGPSQAGSHRSARSGAQLP